MASVVASIIRLIPGSVFLLKAIKPASKADKLLKKFPAVERKFGKTKALKLLRFLIKFGKKHGFGSQGGQLRGVISARLEAEARRLRDLLRAAVKTGVKVIGGPLKGGQRMLPRVTIPNQPRLIKT